MFQEEEEPKGEGGKEKKISPKARMLGSQKESVFGGDKGGEGGPVAKGKDPQENKNKKFRLKERMGGKSQGTLWGAGSESGRTEKPGREGT